jgi:alpha-2-macroglobulin
MMPRSLFALVFLALTSAVLAADAPVQLLLQSQHLEPTSTFDVRFATEMIPRDQIGAANAASPLAFDPPLKGQFVWLSTRSGSFAPSEVLPLGVTYRISLQNGLKDAAGHEVKAKLKETASTPPMLVKGFEQISYFSDEDASPIPQFKILFNTDVNPAEAAKHLTFVDAGGARASAHVEQATDPANQLNNFDTGLSNDRTLLTWAQRFAAHAPIQADAADDKTKTPLHRNILVVSTEKPLPPGKGWQLVVDAGLPSAEWKVSLPEPKRIPIGTVKPFEVSEITPANGRHTGPTLTIVFSKSLAEAITPKNVADWINVKPEPKDLEITVEDQAVNFIGKFTLGVPYRVVVNSGLPSRGPFTLATQVTKDVVFDRIPPRLYFQDFETHQLLTGTRQFRLLSVNVPRIRVTARLSSGDAVPVALHAYARYREHDERLPDDEYFVRVDPEKAPGKTIWTKEFTTTPGADKQQTINLNWDEILGEHKSGAVLLTAEAIEPSQESGKRCGAQAIIQVTDLGAVWKRSKRGTFAHVFSLATGRPIASAKLRLLDDKQKPLGEAVTDARGIALLPPVGEKGKWIIVDHETDSHALDLTDGATEVPLYRLGVPALEDDPGERANDHRAVFLFTERGVYKPGDTVRLKGIVRDLTGDRPRTPGGEKFTLAVTDVQDREVYRKDVKLSEFGSFDQDIKLPGGGLGTYRINATAGEENDPGGSVTFQVQQYRPNTFEVTIAAPPNSAGPGQLALPVAAKYLMGKALEHARIAWTLVARDTTFQPLSLDAFAFCDALPDPTLEAALDRISQLNDQGEAQLDPASGSAVVSAPLPLNAKAPQPRAVKVLCEVTDLNQQTVSESRSFVRHSSDYYFGLRRFQPLVKEGAALPIELIAVRTDGTPLPGPAHATLRITRIDWQSNRVAAAGDATEFENTPIFQPVWQAEIETAPPVKENDRLIPKPVSPAPVVAGKPGQYLLEASGKDADGHEILTSTTFYVAGEGEAVWDYHNPYAIDVVPDKDSYEGGQTATLLVKTPIAGQALVTIERDHVIRSFITALHGNAPTIEIPVTEDDAPNVFVSVMMLRGANDSPRKVKAPEYRVGYCELKIARPSDKLTVYVKPGRSAYQPGETVDLNAEVLDIHGKPVAGAEVVLYAVDEGVLSLTGYKTPDPLAFFHLPHRLGVQTSLTLPTLLREDLVEGDFANKGYLIGDGKGGPDNVDGLRKNFLACALWSPGLRTGADGKLRASFTAPDSLTRYRVVAIAQTKQSQFGGGDSAFEVNKPVMLEPALPRFANLGDTITLRAVLHNTTDLDGQVDVALQLDNTARAAETKRRVALPAHGSVAVDFPVEMIATGTASWRWSAAFLGADGKSAYRDEVQSGLAIGYPAPLVREVHTSGIGGAKAELLRLTDPQILEGSGTVRVSLANTRAVELGEALRQVLHYPYGCVEQTTSNMLPWIVLRNLRGALPEVAKTDEEVAAAVDRGINLLLSMQTDTGGLAYWPGGTQAMLWGSAYGGLGMAMAQKQGFPVPADALDRVLKYISAQLRGIAQDASGYGLSDRCLAVYTLAVAGRPEPAYHELLFKMRAHLSAEDRALLALALIESHGPKAMIEELLKDAPDENAYVESWFGCIAREDALHLLAWTLHDPRSPRVAEMATELFSHRSGGHWITTQGNAWSILALSTYLERVERGNPKSAGEIVWAGSKRPFALNKDVRLATASFPLVEKTAREPMRITKNADGQVFGEVTVEARPPTMEQPRQDRGYSIARRYAKIEDGGQLSPAENLHVGDRVLVTLDIEVRRRATYVAVEDPLPALFEAVNPVFKTQEAVGGEVASLDWISSYRELREDRALFFADLLNPGTYKLHYLARVISAGRATAPAAKIEDMYHPDRFGTTGTARVVALPLK